MAFGSAGGTEESEFIPALGRRIRAVRKARNLTLSDVETISRGELKASVLGAYECGERAISVARLQRLAGLFRVPVAALLPGGADKSANVGEQTGPVVVDLAQLRVANGPEVEMLRHYLAHLQVERGDFNGSVLSVRAEDLQAIAWALGANAAALRERLVDLGVLVSSHHG